jgi:hypothetical protein
MTFGPTNPPNRFPTELIMPMPAAAAVPARNRLGNDQNGPSALQMPAAASASDPIASTGCWLTAASAMPAAPTAAPTATVSFRRPVRSAHHPTTTIAAVAATNGTADSRETCFTSRSVTSLTTDGVQ